MLRVAVACVAIAGAAAIAAPESSGTTIHACANRTTGVLRLATHCRANEQAITWTTGAQSLDDLVGKPCTIRAQRGVFKVVAYNPDSYVLTVACLAADKFEPNNAATTATVISQTAMPVYATVYPATDEDWYSTHTDGTSAMIQASAFSMTLHTTFELYMDGTDPQHLIAAGMGSVGGRYPTGNTPHTWYLHVRGGETDAYNWLLGNF
jgi:hypothetical protein